MFLPTLCCQKICIIFTYFTQVKKFYILFWISEFSWKFCTFLQASGCCRWVMASLHSCLMGALRVSMISPEQLPAFRALTWLLQACHHLTSLLEKMPCSHLLSESDLRTELCAEMVRSALIMIKEKVTLFRGFTHLLIVIHFYYPTFYHCLLL